MTWFRSNNELSGKWQPTLFLLMLLLSLAGCNVQADSPTLPGQMFGEWRTDEPRYHGRAMKLEANKITFGMGGTGPDRAESIESVKMTPKDNPTDYKVLLRTADGKPDQIMLRFTPQNGGELRLKNQSSMVWKRVGEQSAAPKKTPQPEAGTHSTTPQHQTPSPDGFHGDHKTYYKIDCLITDGCKSY